VIGIRRQPVGVAADSRREGFAAWLERRSYLPT